MKKIYLIKKDVNKPAVEGNWIEMNSYEFALFMKTLEGQSRKKNFAQIDACGCDDCIIVAECGEEMAKEMRAEKDAHDYLVDIEKKAGYTIFSYNQQESSEDELTGEEILEDSTVNVENEAVMNSLITLMKDGLKTLSDSEFHLIVKLYLIDNPISAKQYSKKYNIPETTVHCRKQNILKKLRKFIGIKV